MRPPNDDRLRRFWDKYAPRYDRDMTFFERLQFAGGRQWVCSRAIARQPRDQRRCRDRPSGRRRANAAVRRRLRHVVTTRYLPKSVCWQTKSAPRPRAV